MRRLALLLALLLSSPALLAAEGVTDDVEPAAKCAKPHAATSGDAAASPETAGATSVKASPVRSAPANSRSSVRWHSLLPGMFR